MRQLGNDALHIASANPVEQIVSAAADVIHVQQAGGRTGHDTPQPALAFEQPYSQSRSNASITGWTRWNIELRLARQVPRKRSRRPRSRDAPKGRWGSGAKRRREPGRIYGTGSIGRRVREPARRSKSSWR